MEVTPAGLVGVETLGQVEALGAELGPAFLVGQRLAPVLELLLQALPGLHHGIAHDRPLLGRERAETAVEEAEG